MHFIQTAAVAASLSIAVTAQAIRGFNTGSSKLDGSSKVQADFEAEFSNQQQLQGTNGIFSNARLYTMIQGGSTSDPISAIPAAISTNTGLLLGLWCSGGADMFNNELAALTAAIEQYGDNFTSLVRGISVGSEDLYRVSATGIKNDAGVGVGPDVITNYIGQLRQTIAGTALESAQVGHVDTWNVWTNSSNQAVADACDWVGVDEYPYYQEENPNDIANAGALFYDAYDATAGATGKPVWVTETGWPESGPIVGQAEASVANARSFWLQVYCTLPDDVPVYWYTQQDANPVNEAAFGITGDSLTPNPIFDLRCNKPEITRSSFPTPTTSSETSTSTETQSTTTAGDGTTPTTSADNGTPTDQTTGTNPTYVLTETDSSISYGATTTTMTPTSPQPQETVTSSTTVVPRPSDTGAPSDTTTTGPGSAGQTNDPNAAGDIQVGALAFLIVPAVLAFMA